MHCLEFRHCPVVDEASHCCIVRKSRKRSAVAILQFQPTASPEKEFRLRLQMSILSPEISGLENIEVVKSNRVESVSMSTEHFALIGFAARLGASLQNPAVTLEDKGLLSIREEAQLLMNLLLSSPSPKSMLHDEGSETEAIESETNANDSNPVEPTSPDNSNKPSDCPETPIGDENENTTSFQILCPSLSLKAGCRDDNLDSVTPSELFRRPLKAAACLNVKQAAEALARNVLCSFEMALEWRARAWMNSLADVLQQRLARLKISQVNDTNNANNDENTKKESNFDSKNSEESILASREAKVIMFIAQSFSNIFVRNVTTSFRVLSTDTRPKAPLNSRPSLLSPRPMKKRKVVLYPNEDCETDKNKSVKFSLDYAHETKNEQSYDIARNIFFETVLDVSTDQNRSSFKSLKIHAQGKIQGSFVIPKIAEEGEEILSKVSLELDTDSIAKAFEKFSRALVREVTEASMILSQPGPTMVPKTTEDCLASDVLTRPTAEADCYPQSAVVTPRKSSPVFVGTDVFPAADDTPSCATIDVHKDMMTEEAKDPRQISPLVSPPGAPTEQLPYTTSASSAMSFPSLVSPTPTKNGDDFEEDREFAKKLAMKASSNPHKGTDAAQGPFLPALVEVARAALCGT